MLQGVETLAVSTDPHLRVDPALEQRLPTPPNTVSPKILFAKVENHLKTNCSFSRVKGQGVFSQNLRSGESTFSLSAAGLSWIRGELRPMSCPTTWEGLDGTPPLRSGVFVMRSIRGRLSDPRATLASGVLQKSMRGRSRSALLSASVVMVSWSSLMSTRRAWRGQPGEGSAGPGQEEAVSPPGTAHLPVWPAPLQSTQLPTPAL